MVSVTVLIPAIALAILSPSSFTDANTFDASILKGTWTVVYSWPAIPASERRRNIRYKALTPAEIADHRSRWSGPTVDWANVKYSVKLIPSGSGDAPSFLVQEDTDGAFSLVWHRSDAAPRYRYQQVGEYVAVRTVSSGHLSLMYRSLPEVGEVEAAAAALREGPGAPVARAWN